MITLGSMQNEEKRKVKEAQSIRYEIIPEAQQQANSQKKIQNMML